MESTTDGQGTGASGAHSNGNGTGAPGGRPGSEVPAFSPDEASAMEAALCAALGGVRGANPLVGAAVLSPDGRFVTGHHRGAGTPHAEVDALLRARQDDVDLARSTLLVTLEPCNHTGRTDPCSQLVIDAGIPRVVFAIPDPNPVAGGGAATLRAAGIDVRAGLLADEARALNERWLSAVTAGRPFVTAKIAQSLDGCAAAADGTSQWITGDAARERAHEFRAQVSAILVGTGTALADNPRLTVRAPRGAETTTVTSQPVPVVIGERDIPADSHLAANPELLHYRPEGADTFLMETLRDLRERGHDHVLVEGGPGLVGSFLTAGLVDRLLVFTAPVLLGAGLPSAVLPGITTLSAGLRLLPDPAAAPEVLGADRLDHFVPEAPAPPENPVGASP